MRNETETEKSATNEKKNFVVVVGTFTSGDSLIPQLT